LTFNKHDVIDKRLGKLTAGKDAFLQGDFMEIRQALKRRFWLKYPTWPGGGVYGGISMGKAIRSRIILSSPFAGGRKNWFNCLASVICQRGNPTPSAPVHAETGALPPD
jgi:hypothetical protein